MSFMQMMKKRIHFMFKVKPLVYRSTENVSELKDIALQMEAEEKKVEISEEGKSDGAETKSKDSFEKTKKKMIRVLIFSTALVIAAIGIACGCKFL